MRRGIAIEIMAAVAKMKILKRMVGMIGYLRCRNGSAPVQDTIAAPKRRYASGTERISNIIDIITRISKVEAELMRESTLRTLMIKRPKNKNIVIKIKPGVSERGKLPTERKSSRRTTPTMKVTK